MNRPPAPFVLQIDASDSSKFPHTKETGVSTRLDSEESARRWDAHADLFGSLIGEQGDIHRRLLLNPVVFEFLGETSEASAFWTPVAARGISAA